MRDLAVSTLLPALSLFTIGCADAGRAPTDGPRLAVAVAPLSLPGIGFACYDLAVTTGVGNTQTVWSLGDPAWTLTGASQTAPAPGTASAVTADGATVCSDAYGNAVGGDITYIGTCDATLDSDGDAGNGVQNRVTLWVDGLYSAGGAALGEWQDPCPNGCALDVDCVENADSLAEFDLTIMRAAKQGFFDVAVSFADIFCSAKLDTCYADGNDADTLPEPMKLLFGADLARAWTAVYAMACTGGAGAGVDTTLLYGPITVTCTGPDAVFTLDPTLAPGNQSVTVGGHTLGYGIYRGAEDLDCGAAGGCNKVYWNLALNLDDLADFASCTLDLEATAHDGTGFANGVPTAAGLSYPYIQVASPLVGEGGPICQQNPLNGVDPLNGDNPSHVVTTYAGTVSGLSVPTAMCAQFDGAAVSATGGCQADSAATWVQHTFTGTFTMGAYGIDVGTPYTARLVYDAGQAPDPDLSYEGVGEYHAYTLQVVAAGQTFTRDLNATLSVQDNQGYDAILTNGTSDGAGLSILWYDTAALASSALPTALPTSGWNQSFIAVVGNGTLYGPISTVTSTTCGALDAGGGCPAP